jgi:plasmid stabilization system protein ParE
MPTAGQLSTPASKWEARLRKDREKLFTFLSHDGVPWNNNNAEHAIKAFARIRRAIEGLSTPKGIEVRADFIREKREKSGGEPASAERYCAKFLK